MLVSYYGYLKNPQRWEGRQPWAMGASSDRQVPYCKSSNMRQSQPIPHICHTSIKGSAKYSHLPPRPLLSNVLAKNGSPRRGRKRCFLTGFAPVLHAFTQGDSHQGAVMRSSYNLVTQNTSHTPSLRETSLLSCREKKGMVWKSPWAKLFKLVSSHPASHPLSGQGQLCTSRVMELSDFCKANATQRGRKQHCSLKRMVFHHPAPPGFLPEPSLTSWHRCNNTEFIA